MLSEHLAFAGCAQLLTSVLAVHGIDHAFTGPELQARFVGQNFRGMLRSLMEEYDLPLTEEEIKQLVTQEEDAVIAQLHPPELQPCEGVKDALNKVDKGTTLAVVSSSALRRVNASLQATDLAGFFGDRVYSAATSLPTPTSKPDPAIYLHAMKALGVQPGDCVAVEDSRSGTLSAVRAGIRTIGYIGSYPPEEMPHMADVLKESGATVIMHHWNEFGQCLKDIHA